MLNGDPKFEIKYAKGIWTRRVGLHYLVDGPQFQYKYEHPGHWVDQLNQYDANAKEFWLRYYEPHEGDVIVDVGAGRGEDTFAFSRAVGKKGRVIAIEAHPPSFAILEKFCTLNGLKNVTALQLALMDKPGKVRIHPFDSSWTGNAVQYGNGSEPEVGATTLENLCEVQRIESISFLKMNIEGAERYALVGMGSVMSRIRHICVACHDFRADMGHGEQFRTRAFVCTFLREYGFTLDSRQDDPRDYVRDHIFGLTPCASPVPVERASD
jgi:FkbM family methyltransferase